jgi:hypothetical protein
MDPNTGHTITIAVQCEVVAKIMTIPLHFIQNARGQFNTSTVRHYLRTQYRIAQPIAYNQPFTVDSQSNLTIILIRHNDDEDEDAFAEAREFTRHRLRANHRILFYNGTGARLDVTIGGTSVQQRTWPTEYTGAIHTNTFSFTRVYDEDRP